MAAVFGASALTDAFNVAFRIPNMFRRVLGEGAFSQAFVPILAGTRATHGDAAAKVLVDRVATVLVWVLLLTCLAGVLGAPALVWVLASGLRQQAEGYDAAVVMTRWMFPYIGFMSLVTLAAGVLNTWKQFVVAAITPVLLNVALIAAVLLGAPWFKSMGVEPIYALALGVMVGGAAQLALQVPALMRLGMLPHVGLTFAALRTGWADPGTRQVARMMGPALVGSSVAQISLVINTQIASYLAPGSVSWLSYADRLMEFPTALLGVALGVVLVPQLTAAKAVNDRARYSAMLDWGLRLVLLFSLPCAVALLTFSTPITATLLHYGKYTAHDVHQTAAAMAGYGVGLLGLVAIKVLASSYYASQDVKTPMKIALGVLALTQLLNVALVPRFAHAGLALSIGLGALFNAGFLLAGLLRQGTYRPVAGWLRLVGQVSAASAVLAVFLVWGAAAVPWIAMRADIWMRMGLLASMVAGGGAIYFVVLRVLGLNFRQFMRH